MLNNDIVKSKTFEVYNNDSKIITKSISVEKTDGVLGIVDGYLTTFGNPDAFNDIMLDTLFDEQMPLIQSNIDRIDIRREHKYSKRFNIDYQDLQIWKDSKGYRFKFQASDDWKKSHPQNWEALREWILNVKSGKTRNGISMGFLPQECYTQNGYRYFTKAKLLEISLTNSPANPMATAIFKSTIPQYPIHLSDSFNEEIAIKDWKEYTCVDAKPTPSYQKGFLFNEGDKDSFESYQYPIIEIVNDEPMINSKAVINAHSKLSSIRKNNKNIAQSISDSYNISCHLLEKINEKRIQAGQSALSIPKNKYAIHSIQTKASAVEYMRKNIKGKSISNSEINLFIEKCINIGKKTLDKSNPIIY